MSGQQGRFKKVILDGVLASKPVDQIHWTFVLSLVDGKSDAGLIKDIKIGIGIEAQGKKGSKDYRPAIVPKSLTCWHCTQKKQNFTVFYRWLKKNEQIIVIGYGKHTAGDNQEYRVEWSDGSTDTIHLKKTSPKGEIFLADKGIN